MNTRFQSFFIPRPSSGWPHVRPQPAGAANAGGGPGIKNAFVIFARAGRLPIADVVTGVFKRLAGDRFAVLPKAFALGHLTQVVARRFHNLTEPTLHSVPLLARSA